MFKNKLDEQNNITKNEGRLVAKGYNQIEDINFDETLLQLLDLKQS